MPLNRHDLRPLALVFALFVALTALLTYPQVRRLSTAVSDPADPLLNAWALAWVAHQVPIDPAHVFDANIFHPERRTLAYSETLIVPGLMAAPLLWSGAPTILAYNVVFLSGFVLSGVAMFVLARSLTGRTDAAILSAIFFAFQPFRFDHYPHLQMQMTQFMPLALWALHRVVASRTIGAGLLVGAFAACTALSCMYYGVFFSAYLAVVGAILVAAAGRAGFGRRAVALAAGAALCGLLVLPAARAYALNRQLVGVRSVEEVKYGSAEPRNYLATSEASALYAWTSGRFGKGESRLFPGLTVVALALVGALPPMSAARAAYVAATVFSFDVSLGWNGVSYPFLYRFVTPFRALRVPARIGILVGLSLSILAAFGITRIMQRITRPIWRRAAALLIGTLALIEYHPGGLSLFTVWGTIPPVYESMPADEEGALLELPMEGFDPAYMYFSTTHWRPLVNGYSGFSPPSYWELRGAMQHFPEDGAIPYLQRRRVRFVVLHEAFYRPDVYRSVIAHLDEHREAQLVVTSRWQGHEVRLYRIRWPAELAS